MKVEDLITDQVTPYIKRFVYFSQRISDLRDDDHPGAYQNEMYDHYRWDPTELARDMFTMLHIHGDDFIDLSVGVRESCKVAMETALHARGYFEEVVAGYTVWKYSSRFAEIKKCVDEVNHTLQAFCQAYRTNDDGSIRR